MTLSTHVLDAAHGRPAAGLRIRWDTLRGEDWEVAGSAVTDGDGRVTEWSASEAGAGVHRLVFATGDWFRGSGRSSFFPEVVVHFEVVDAQAHHHVPLLLGAYSYTTYRGS